jgi:diguanylate cyclase (GGDEF)-like protein
MTTSQSKIEFDYETLELNTRNRIKQNVSEIKQLIRRTAQDIINIGKKLREIKQDLGHGRFRDWLRSEFSWSISTANKIMQVSKQFENIDLTELNFAPSALYLLAAPATPTPVRTEALNLARQGQYINYSLAKQLIDEYQNTINLTTEQHSDVNIIEIDEPENVNQLSRFYHRDFFEMILEREWLRMAREKKFISLIMCIIDDFKHFNKAWSELGKNVCFRKIIMAIEASAKRPADLVTSYEQGKFMVLLPNTNAQGAMRVAGNIIDKVKQLNIIIDSEHQKHLKVNLAVTSVIPSEDISLKSLVNSLQESSHSLEQKKQKQSILVHDPI